MGLGVTESQSVIQVILILTGYHGQEIWSNSLVSFLGNSDTLPFYNMNPAITSAYNMRIADLIIAGILIIANFLSIALFLKTLYTTERKAEGVVQWVPVIFILGIGFTLFLN